MSHLPKQAQGSARHTVNVPEFITKKNIGLGDAIKKVTTALRFQPCGGCKRRAAHLNRFLVFSGRRFK